MQINNNIFRSNVFYDFYKLTKSLLHKNFNNPSYFPIYLIFKNLTNAFKFFLKNINIFFFFLNKK